MSGHPAQQGIDPVSGQAGLRRVIDRLNILEAVRLAMRTCVRALAEPGSVVVVDAVELGEEDTDIRSSVRADATFFSVAAASIVAKVHRDRLMVRIGRPTP